MTRDMYIMQLEEGLAGVDPMLAKEVIDDVKLHFDTGMAFGRTEEELCEELGDVRDMIADCIHMDAEARTARSRDQEAGLYAIERVPQENPVYRKLWISSENMEIRTIPSGDGRIHVSLEEDSSKAFRLEESYTDDTYRVQVVRTGGILFPIRLFGSRAKLSVQIPAGMISLQLKTTNGVISVNDIVVSEDITLETTNGAISVRRSKADTVSIRSVNGVTRLTQSEMHQLDISTVNGSISGENIHFLRARTTSRNGFIRLEVDPRDRMMVAQATAKLGGVRVKDTIDILRMEQMGLTIGDCVQVSASTVCGGIDISAI